MVGVENGSSEIVPLVNRLYSQDADDFLSENQELLDAMGRVHQATSGKGIFVIDRGGDRRRGDRHLVYRGKLRETLQLAQRCTTPYGETVIKEKEGKEKAYHIQFGFVPVRLPEHPERQLWMVVVTGFGHKPLMLLTTEPMRRNRKVLWWIVQAYLTRRRVEDTIRFIKQSYKLEDIRVMTYERLKTMAALVLAASFFTAVHVGYKPKLQILALHALNAAQRIFGIPNFRYYALADGIKEILTKSAHGTLHQETDQSGHPSQLSLFLA